MLSIARLDIFSRDSNFLILNC